MGFLKRLSSSLFSPKDVIQYRTDAFWVTILYFIFLLILSILPASISIIRSDSFDYETRRAIVNHFSGDEDIPYAIINGKLVHDNNDIDFVYSEDVNNRLRIVMTLDRSVGNDISTTTMNIFFRDDGIYLLQSVINIKFLSYSEYPELMNLDFSDLLDRNSLTWDIIFSVMNQEVSKMRPITNILQIAVIGAAELLAMIFISLILAFFQSFTLTGILSFRKIWKMCIYALTPYVFGNVLGTLFGITMLFYIGLGLTAIFAASISQNLLRESSGKDNRNDL